MMQVNNVSHRIKDFIVKHFPLARNRNVNSDDHLLENGILDSLGVLELVTYLEQEFKISVSDEDLVPDNFQTIRDLSNFVQKKNNSNSEQILGQE